MKIIDAALDRSRMVLAILVFILIAGGFSYFMIPKEADPDINIPIIYTVINLEGVSPEDAERLIVRPLEKEVKGIEGVKEMRSTAFDGGANVLLEFEAGYDIDVAIDDVREKVDKARPNLPSDIDEPTINEVNLSLFPVIVISLYGDVPERTLLDYSRRLQNKLEEIDTVLEAKITGERDETVEIIIDPVKLESYNIQPTDITRKLSADNQLVAAGAMDTGAGRFTIKVPGVFENVLDIMNMPLFSSGEGVIRFKDIATVQRTFKDATTYARFNGKPALAIEVSKRLGTNIVETIEKARSVVETETANWPSTIQVQLSQDKSTQIKTMLVDLQNNVITAVLLVMVVVIASLGIRGGLLVGIAIPGSFLAAIMILYLSGFTVNIVVLFSLILAVGMLVDGAIVVSEYADRKMSEGLNKDQAYGLAAKRMAWPIIASTATTLAAFLPLLFWPGIVGEFMKFLPITLIITLTASLFMALIFLPTLGKNLVVVSQLVIGLIMVLVFTGIFTEAAILLGISKDNLILPELIGAIAGFYAAWKIRLFIARQLNSGSVELGELSKFRNVDDNAPAESVNNLSADQHPTLNDLIALKGFTGQYVRMLNRFLSVTPLIAVFAIVALAGSWIAYGTFGKGVEFFPNVEPEQLLVNIHARGNLSVKERDNLVLEVEKIILDLQALDAPFKSINSASGIFPARDDSAEDIIGNIQLELKEWDQRKPAAEIKAYLREKSKAISGILIEVREPEAGPPTGKPVQVELSAEEPEFLDEPAAAIRNYMDNMAGLEDIEDSRPIPGIEWRLSVNRNQATKFNVDIQTLGGFVQMVTRGVKIDTYRPNTSDEEVDILLRLPEEYRTLDQLDNLRILTPKGPVPVSNFLSRVAENKTGTLKRIDGRRVLTIKADVQENVLPESKVQELQTWIDSQNFSKKVEIKFRGEDKEQKQAEAFLGKAFIVSLFLIAVILVTQFNSFYATFLVLTAVIMSTVGVLLGLLITDQPFGIVMTGIGVIALAGIVVNNNIILIDTYDRLKHDIGDRRTAILLTCAQRLRPVMLTTCTTILGLLPMTLQLNIDFAAREVSHGAPSTQWWVSLSTAIVFGLAFAAILTLIVTPSLLKLPEDIRHILGKFLNRKNLDKALPAEIITETGVKND